MKKKYYFLITLVVLTLIVVAIFFFKGNSIVEEDKQNIEVEGFILPVNFTASNKDNVSMEYSKGDFKVEIGKIQENDGFSLSRWNGEVKIEVEMPRATSSSATLSLSNSEAARVSYENYSVDYYMKSEEEFEFDTIIYSEPNTNKLSWKIDLINLNCIYQPPLNEIISDTGDICNATNCWNEKSWEINEWRPMNVAGSYACYHNSNKGNEYMAGKAFHIYRPTIYDDRGWQVFGNITIDHGELIVEIPQDFLHEATYPIVVDPVFGKENVGSSTKTLLNRARGSPYVINENGVATHITGYCTNPRGMGVYNDSTGRPGDLALASSEIVSNTGWDQETVNISFNLESGSTYWLFNIDNGGGAPACRYDSGSGYYGADAWPPDDPASFIATSSREYSIFVNYTTGAPPEDSCSPTSPLIENHQYECSDDCVIGSSVDADGFDIIINGTGTFTVNADITNYGILQIFGESSSEICRVSCFAGCFTH